MSRRGESGDMSPHSKEAESISPILRDSPLAVEIVISIMRRCSISN